MIEFFVIDCNIWVMLDKPISALSRDEIDCVEFCRDWMDGFIAGESCLVVDNQYLILKEYRQNVKNQQQSLAGQYLGQLERQPRNRIVEVNITMVDGCALVPNHLMINDRSDRKYIAVALEHSAKPPIVNATDSDWEIHREMLAAGGIEVRELCPKCISGTLQRKSGT